MWRRSIWVSVNVASEKPAGSTLFVVGFDPLLLHS